jgi:hypothetical protein
MRPLYFLICVISPSPTPQSHLISFPKRKVFLLKVLSSKVDLAKSGAWVTVAPWKPVAAHHRVHIEWQRPLSGVHSIMMENLAPPDVYGGFPPTPFRYIYHRVQRCGVRSS